MTSTKGLHVFFTRRDCFVLSTSLWPANRRVPLREGTVGDLLVDAAARFPDRCAMVAPTGRRWSYTELLDDVQRTATVLLETFDPGQPVVPEPYVAHLAHIVRLACAVAGLPRVEGATCDAELEWLVGDTGPTMPGLEALATGGTYIPFRPDPDELDAPTVEGLTILDAAAPIVAELAARKECTDSLRVVVSRAASIESEVADLIENTMRAELATVFGVSGATAAMCASHSEDSLDDRIQTVGRPLPHTAVMIAEADTARSVACGTEGRLLTSGIGAMTNPRAAAGADDWVDTGLRASMDTRGFVIIGGS